MEEEGDKTGVLKCGRVQILKVITDGGKHLGFWLKNELYLL